MPSKCTSENKGKVQLKPCGCTFHSRAAQSVSNRHRVLVEETEIKQYTVSASQRRNISSFKEGKLLKELTGKREPGTRNPEPGTGVWERVYTRKLRAFKFTGKRNNILEIPSYLDFCILYNFIELM